MTAGHNAFFAMVLAGQLTLLATFLKRGRIRTYPLFFVYVLANLIEGALLYWAYLRYGFSSEMSKRMWIGCEGFVLLSRAAAVAELCHHLLSAFRGIWALAWRLLVFCGLLLLVTSIWATGWRLQYAVSRGQLGLELTIAILVTAFLVFARIYHIPIALPARMLLIGFFLYSYSTTINDFAVGKLPAEFAQLNWVIGSITYIATVSVWIRALWQTESIRVAAPAKLLSTETYRRLAPEINLRLKLLNQRLSRFFQTEAEAEQP
jgi:hypothetical protein